MSLGTVQRHRRAIQILAMLMATPLWVACASMPPQDALLDRAARSWEGRLSLRIEGEQPSTQSARFELTGGPERGRLNLISPIGTVVLQASWSPEGAWLATPSGQRQFASMDALTAEVLGAPLPIGAMFDWLAGQASVSRPSTLDAVGFRQDGWLIDTRERKAGRLGLSRSEPLPALSLRILLDSPG